MTSNPCSTCSIGIERIAFATGSLMLPLEILAEDLGENPSKYRVGLGQEMMGVCAEDEDVVTLAAEAASLLLETIPKESIRTLLFATESGIDQSKSAGIYVHRLIQLTSHCRVVELKQACYGAVGALQLAKGYVRAHLDERVLVIASDTARYEARSTAEPTQGCGAAAFIVSRHPDVLHIEDPCGLHTEDLMDFWRPNYRETAIVDGKFSAKVYFQALCHCWKDLKERFGLSFKDFHRFCYHLPFIRLAQKAHTRLVQEWIPDSLSQQLEALEPSFCYSRSIGNAYSASVFLGILSLLEQTEEDLTDQRLAVFSYGSGMVSELFSLKVASSYREHLHRAEHEKNLQTRTPIGIERYRRLQNQRLPEDGSCFALPHVTPHRYRLSGIQEHKRIYERVR